MWTAVRLASVCAIGLSGVIALRTGLVPPPSKPVTVSDPDDVVLVSLVSKADKLPVVDEDEKKVVNAERIHLPALDANAKAPIAAERETEDRRGATRRHWNRGSRHKRRH